MKTSINTIAAIIVVAMTFATSFGKTRNMTTAQYELQFHQMDSRLVGTWETEKTGKTEYCQFNANGTYVSFQKAGSNYVITGNGKWVVKNEAIYIVHGNEMSSAVAYQVEGNQLVFGSNIAYSKPSAMYANK